MKKLFIWYSLKGYRRLKKKNLSFLDDIKYFVEDDLLLNNTLKNQKINKTYINFFLNLRFNKVYLFFFGLSRGRLNVLPISRVFYSKIEKKFNIKVSFFLSYSLYSIFVLERFLVFFKVWFKIFFFIYNFKSQDKNVKKIYLYSIPNNVFKMNSKSDNLISFILKEFNVDKKNSIIYHNNKNIDQTSIVGLKLTYLQFPITINNLDLKKKVNIFRLLFLSVFKILLSKIMFSYFLDPTSYFLKSANLISKLNIDYFIFNNSDYINRPLYTYEKSISPKVFFLFYSLSCQMAYSTKNKVVFGLGWKSFDWPNYILWSDIFDKIFKDYRYLKNLNAKIIDEPINLVDNGNNLAFHNKSISIFNVYNRSLIENFIYCRPKIYEHFTFNNSLKFISDITEYSIKNKIYCYIKEKRKSHIKNKKYLNFLDNISKNKYIEIIDSDFSAKRMISDTDLTVSFPFTSTATIGKKLNKKSIYYDSTEKITDQNIANLNINIINNKKNLYNFFDNFFKNLT